MSVALLTAIYGDYDVLQPLPADHGFDRAVCVTDNPDLSADGWEVLHVPSSDTPILAAKLPKMRPFDFVTTDVAVWLDGSFQVVDGAWRDFCVRSVEGFDVVAWEHPEGRTCLFEEAAYCQDWPRYRPYPIREQVGSYRRAGMPGDFGLWACGGLAWRNSDRAKRFGAEWARHQVEWSIQDQISFPFVAWRSDARVGTFAGHEFQNPYLRYVGHR
jgi:hypothetical protein